MLALGLVAGVCVTGSKLFKRPGTGRQRAGPTKQQRILGVLAFLVVAASPLIRLWRSSLTDLALLQQTFLVAAIGLLALLLYALLQRPHTRQFVSDSNTEDNEDNIDAIHIDASAALAPAKTDSSNLSFIANLDQLIADNSADLSDTEQLYAELRLHADNVELPDKNEWLADFDNSVNLDDLLVLADEHIATPSSEPTVSIIEGELLNESIATVETTGEYAHPGVSDQTIPTTLSESLILGQSHTLALQQHIDDLNSKLAELQKIHQQINAEQQQSQLASAQMIINRDQLLDFEAKARDAAEGVITAQRAMLDRSKQQQSQFGQLLQSERARLVSFRDEAARSKSMARQAAALARKAAVAHQTIRDVARREQEARLRSQESAKKAVDIARNAISALAAEERKNAATHH